MYRYFHDRKPSNYCLLVAFEAVLPLLCHGAFNSWVIIVPSCASPIAGTVTGYPPSLLMAHACLILQCLSFPPPSSPRKLYHRGYTVISSLSFSLRHEQPEMIQVDRRIPGRVWPCSPTSNLLHGKPVLGGVGAVVHGVDLRLDFKDNFTILSRITY